MIFSKFQKIKQQSLSNSFFRRIYFGQQWQPGEQLPRGGRLARVLRAFLAHDITGQGIVMALNPGTTDALWIPPIVAGNTKVLPTSSWASVGWFPTGISLCSPQSFHNKLLWWPSKYQQHHWRAGWTVTHCVPQSSNMCNLNHSQNLHPQVRQFCFQSPVVQVPNWSMKSMLLTCRIWHVVWI